MKSASLVLLLSLPACGLQNMYEKEYTFYDPDGKEVEGEGAPGEEAKTEGEEASETEPAAPETAKAEAAKPPAKEAGTPATRRPAGAAISSSGRADLDRIFQLEAALDELNRAIRDGLDFDGSLASKRQEVELELAGRKRAAGESYGQERQRRIQALKEFKIQKPASRK
ncbi:MAG: hypothetical protein ACYTG5_19765 [Planctomycetota bacterium]|jgi:hypothetical protein